MHGGVLSSYLGRDLSGYLGRDKTLATMKERFYSPHMRRDVTKFLQLCYTCQILKGRA